MRTLACLLLVLSFINTTATAQDSPPPVSADTPSALPPLTAQQCSADLAQGTKALLVCIAGAPANLKAKHDETLAGTQKFFDEACSAENLRKYPENGFGCVFIAMALEKFEENFNSTTVNKAYIEQCVATFNTSSAGTRMACLGTGQTYGVFCAATKAAATTCAATCGPTCKCGDWVAQPNICSPSNTIRVSKAIVPPGCEAAREASETCYSSCSATDATCRSSCYALTGQLVAACLSSDKPEPIPLRANDLGQRKIQAQRLGSSKTVSSKAKPALKKSQGTPRVAKNVVPGPKTNSLDRHDLGPTFVSPTVSTVGSRATSRSASGKAAKTTATTPTATTASPLLRSQ